jgi:5'(3')-deoxyribonucleotidase
VKSGARRKRLLVDVDEVLAYLQNPVLDIIRRVTKKDWKLEDFKVWDLFSVLNPEQRKEVFAEMAVPGFCLNLEPVPGSPEAIKELQGLVDVFAVTNPHDSVLWVSERYEWLRVHFGLDKDHVAFLSSKYLIPGNWLIEDNLDQLRRWKMSNCEGVPLLWNTTNNHHMPWNGVRIYDWSDVIDIVQKELS